MNTWIRAADLTTLTYAAIDPRMRDSAILFLRTMLPDESRELLRGLIRADPDWWWAEYHHLGGMSVRNSLREAGYTEQALGVITLDDVWVPLLEAAVSDEPKAAGQSQVTTDGWTLSPGWRVP